MSHHLIAPCPGTPVSPSPPIVLRHLLALSQSSPVSPFLLHHPGLVHISPSPCLSSWDSRTHTMQQPPNIHAAPRANEISACRASLCLCPVSCFTTFSLYIKIRDLQSIIQKVRILLSSRESRKWDFNPQNYGNASVFYYYSFCGCAFIGFIQICFRMLL